MNLLLDARRKSRQQRESPGPALSCAEVTQRGVARQLFRAKGSAAGLSAHARRRAAVMTVGFLLPSLTAAVVFFGDDREADVSAREIAQIGAISAPARPAEASLPQEISPAEVFSVEEGDVARTEPVILADEEAAAESDEAPVRIERRKVGSMDGLLQDAYRAYRGGEAEEARRLYLLAHQEDGRNADVLLGLAMLAHQRDDIVSAEKYYFRVLDIDPRNAAAHAGLSSLRADDGASESRLKNLLQEQGDSAALHFAIGNLYAGQARWSEAQNAYFNAYALQPDGAEFAHNLAVSLDHLGQDELAAQHYQRALQLDSSRSAGLDHAHILQRIADLLH
ncbi:MAG: hypothetical protein U1C96_07100 [Gallionella sp.]|nr:hypothetical protein [Gallionella sp.]